MSDPVHHWGILGGGILGMTLALRLRQQGHRVTLCEAADHLGGLADAWKFGEITWDRHYHVTLLSDRVLRKMLNELNLEDNMIWVETRTGFYIDGHHYSMSNTIEFLRFPPLRLLDKLRLGGTIFYASRLKNWKRLEQIPVSDWLRKWSGRRTFEKIWLPLLRAKLGENYQLASAAFIWAIIARMYAARRSGLKKEMFGYLRGGYARMLERFEHTLRDAGIEIRTAQPATDVRAKAGGVQVTFSEGRMARFDQVAVTMPAPIAARVCRGLSEAEIARLGDIKYQGIICASTLLRRPLRGFYVTNIADTSVPFTAVIEMTALVDPATFGGHHLIYLPKYVDPADSAFEQSDETLRGTFTQALLRIYPELTAEDILNFKVSRVRHVLALSTLGYSDRLPPMQTSIPGVYIVNSAHITNGTLNVNETMQLAERAAQEIAGCAV